MPDDTRKIGRDRTFISQERLMARVDYYLSCELDGEYDRERPEVVRKQLKAALRRELLRAWANEVRDRTTSQDCTEAGLRNAVKQVVGNSAEAMPKSVFAGLYWLI